MINYNKTIYIQKKKTIVQVFFEFTKPQITVNYKTS